jgi:hypothetical protein
MSWLISKSNNPNPKGGSIFLHAISSKFYFGHLRDFFRCWIGILLILCKAILHINNELVTLKMLYKFPNEKKKNKSNQFTYVLKGFSHCPTFPLQTDFFFLCNTSFSWVSVLFLQKTWNNILDKHSTRIDA